MAINKIAVTCEELLKNLKKEFPNLTEVGMTITSAGAGGTLAGISVAALRHDKNGDKHTTHHDG